MRWLRMRRQCLQKFAHEFKGLVNGVLSSGIDVVPKERGNNVAHSSMLFSEGSQED
jgi:hypothetical protein